jgi:hypothetical protein
MKMNNKLFIIVNVNKLVTFLLFETILLNTLFFKEGCQAKPDREIFNNI